MVESTVDAIVPDYRATAPAYYDADVLTVSDEQFTAVLGREIPESTIISYPNLTIANTLEDSETGKNGKKIVKLLRKFVGSEGMACAIALQTPIKNFISMSLGIFSPKMAQELLDVLNDKKPLKRGLAAMIIKAIPKVIAGLPGLLKSI